MTAPNPRHKLSGTAITVDGVTFAPYRTGILKASWITADGRLEVHSNFRKTGHNASIDNEYIRSDGKLRKPKDFRTQHGAMRAAIEAMKEKDSAK